MNSSYFTSGKGRCRKFKSLAKVLHILDRSTNPEIQQGNDCQQNSNRVSGIKTTAK